MNHCASKKHKPIEQHNTDALIFALLFYYKDFAPLEHKNFKIANCLPPKINFFDSGKFRLIKNKELIIDGLIGFKCGYY